MKIRAAQLRRPREVVLGERELPPGEDEVLVKGHLSGICGSDKTMYRGDIPDTITLPLWIGHESGGTVVEVGSKVREYEAGDGVTVFNWCNWTPWALRPVAQGVIRDRCPLPDHSRIPPGEGGRGLPGRGQGPHGYQGHREELNPERHISRDLP